MTTQSGHNVECPHCAARVLLAPYCTQCGASLAGSSRKEKTVTIEATSKRWKLLHAVGVMLIVAGVFPCAAGTTTGAGGDWAVGLFLLGGVLYTVGRFGGWWHHG